MYDPYNQLVDVVDTLPDIEEIEDELAAIALGEEEKEDDRHIMEEGNAVVRAPMVISCPPPLKILIQSTLSSYNRDLP